MVKTALITGITGQDGSYLAELLLEKGYEVHGIVRRSSSFNTGRIDHIFDKITLHYGDMTDGTAISNLINRYSFDEIYHLAAQSHVKVSFEMPEYTSIADGLSTLKLLEAVRQRNIRGEVYYPKIYNACTSEMFGTAPAPQGEDTPFEPCSPYGTAKLYSYWIARNYRDSYEINISNGILFNHESPRRGETFVTRKVTKAAARIALGLQDHLYLGNTKAVRDWGHAKDFVEAMYLMLQQDLPGDYVIATGEAHSVKELADYAFNLVGIRLHWNHNESVAIDFETGKPVIYANREQWERPNEVPYLRGDPRKAKTKLGWQPKYDFYKLIEEMVKYDYDQQSKEHKVPARF